MHRTIVVAAILAGLVVLVGSGPAKAGGFGWFRGPSETVATTPTPQQRYVTYRPVLSRLMEPKQFYLGNYAGVYYPSRRPGAVLTPTTFRAMTGRPERTRLFAGDR